MEKKNLMTAMKASISEVFETMFFLPLEFSDCDDLKDFIQAGNEDLLVSKIDFDGPFSGHFLFLIPFKSASSLTADFLGQEEESIVKDQATATVKEILNMITGKTFSIFDDQAVFKLGIPEMFDQEETDKVNGSTEEISVLINTMETTLAAKMVVLS
jgi:chemotaxis protein CheY-P-specific phosphatase CheC